MNTNVSKKGFTLIEIIIAVSMTFFIGVAIFDFEKNILSGNKLWSGELSAEQETRSAVRSILKEARAASPSEGGAYAISAAATSSFTFFSDIDNDRVAEKVRYFLQGGILKKGVIEPTGNPPTTYNAGSEVIKQEIRFVTNGTSTNLFSYYNSGYAGTSSPLSSPVDVTQVRLVKMTILIDAQPNKPPDAMEFTTQVSLRNLKDNL